VHSCDSKPPYIIDPQNIKQAVFYSFRRKYDFLYKKNKGEGKSSIYQFSQYLTQVSLKKEMPSVSNVGYKY